MRFSTPLLSLLLSAGLALPAAAQQAYPLPDWLSGATQPKPVQIFSPTEDEAEMCPLRPSRVSILKVGLSPDRYWRRHYLSAIPLTLGYERRITPDVSWTVTIGSALAPWNREKAAYPKLRAFDVTLGARVYLGSLFRGGASRPEFSGPYAALEARRQFVAGPLTAADPTGTTSYRYLRSTQLVLGQQVRIGEHGLLDMAAGLRRTTAPGTRAAYAPTASLTIGLIY